MKKIFSIQVLINKSICHLFFLFIMVFLISSCGGGTIKSAPSQSKVKVIGVLLDDIKFVSNIFHKGQKIGKRIDLIFSNPNSSSFVGVRFLVIKNNQKTYNNFVKGLKKHQYVLLYMKNEKIIAMKRDNIKMNLAYKVFRLQRIKSNRIKERKQQI